MWDVTPFRFDPASKALGYVNMRFLSEWISTKWSTLLRWTEKSAESQTVRIWLRHGKICWLPHHSVRQPVQ